MRVRVMHVLTSLEVGGAEMLVVRMLESQTARESVVVALRRSGPLATRLGAAGIPIETLDVPMNRGALALAGALRRAVRTYRPQVLHTHNVSPLIGGALATLGNRTIRHVHTEHGRSALDSIRHRAAFAAATRGADARVAVSQDAAMSWAKVARLPPDRIQVIRNGITPGSPPVRERRPGMRAATVARLERVKDIATMLRAVPQIAANAAGFHLDIYGDGSERLALEALVASLGIGDRVTFHGTIADVPAALARADVYLCSSLSEGVSLTLLEAMVAGLPIVATDVGGNPEVVADADNGYLVPPASPSQLATAVTRILTDPDRAVAFGEQSRRRVEREFSLTAMVDAYERVYRAP